MNINELYIGMRIRIIEDSRSTSEFIGEEGIITSCSPDHVYPQVQFDRVIRGQRRWFVPVEDLEEVFDTPEWEV